MPQSIITTTAYVPNGIALAGTGGTRNGVVHVLSSAAITVPLTNWPAISTNTFDPDGNFSITNPVSPAQSNSSTGCSSPENERSEK